MGNIMVVITGIIMALTFIVGYVNNILWLFANGFGDWGGEVVVSLIGIFMVPLGVIHGMYLWF